MELLGLIDYCIQPRQGSYRNVRYAPIVAFDTPTVPHMTAIDDNRLLALPPFRAGYAWLKLPVLFGNERGFDTGMSRTKQGVIEDQTVTGFLPPMIPAVALELSKMAELRDFIVVVYDPREFWWLVGSLACPAVFTFDFDGGKTLQSGSKTKVQFKAKNSMPIAGLPYGFI
jgi:hypothetical protein